VQYVAVFFVEIVDYIDRDLCIGLRVKLVPFAGEKSAQRGIVFDYAVMYSGEFSAVG